MFSRFRRSEPVEPETDNDLEAFPAYPGYINEDVLDPSPRTQSNVAVRTISFDWPSHPITGQPDSHFELYFDGNTLKQWTGREPYCVDPTSIEIKILSAPCRVVGVRVVEPLVEKSPNGQDYHPSLVNAPAEILQIPVQVDNRTVDVLVDAITTLHPTHFETVSLTFRRCPETERERQQRFAKYGGVVDSDFYDATAILTDEGNPKNEKIVVPLFYKGPKFPGSEIMVKRVHVAGWNLGHNFFNEPDKGEVELEQVAPDDVVSRFVIGRKSHQKIEEDHLKLMKGLRGHALLNGFIIEVVPGEAIRSNTRFSCVVTLHMNPYVCYTDAVKQQKWDLPEHLQAELDRRAAPKINVQETPVADAATLDALENQTLLERNPGMIIRPYTFDERQ